MTIAVHISIQENFNYNCFTILAASHPEHHFIFIFDKPFDQQLVREKNITPVLLTPQVRNRLLAHYWYNFKIPSLLNKYNADIFVSDGVNCSTRTETPQCMILHDLSFLQKENMLPRSETRYLKKYFRKFVSIQNCIAVTNQYILDKLVKDIPSAKKKVSYIPFGLDDTNETNSYAHQQAIKDKYSEGKEYFLAYITGAAASNTTTLLKAFSAFKKRQLSNMQLLLVLAAAQKENPVKDFATYKYRNEVRIITRESEVQLNQLTSAAYAGIYLPAMELMEDKGLIPVKNHVPLITIDNDLCKSLYGKAALYTAPDEKNIAEKMMLIYKDENLRNELINNTMALSASLSWSNTGESLWKVLVNTAAQ